MFRQYIGVTSQTSKSFRNYLTSTTPPKRTLSTLSALVDGECYWKQTPWKHVPAEEFNSYRWQVSRAESLTLSIAQVWRLAKLSNDTLTFLAPKYRDGQAQT
jgi:hypothetical protein